MDASLLKSDYAVIVRRLRVSNYSILHNLLFPRCQVFSIITYVTYKENYKLATISRRAFPVTVP